MEKLDKSYAESGGNLRPSTKFHNKTIMHAYSEVMKSLGEYKYLVPKSHIYERVRSITGYCTKKIADVINHHSEDAE